MKPITVNKDVLLANLRENQKIHAEEYAQLKIDYNDKAIIEFTRLLKSAKKRPENVDRSLELDKPNSYDKEYSTVIGMFEMANEETFELDREHYEKYILNEWSWTRSFENTKLSYGR